MSWGYYLEILKQSWNKGAERGKEWKKKDKEKLSKILEKRKKGDKK